MGKQRAYGVGGRGPFPREDPDETPWLNWAMSEIEEGTMVELKSDGQGVTPGAEPGVFVTEASDCGLAPGEWPMYVKLDDQILCRVALDESGAGYRSDDLVLTIFND